MTAPDPDRPCVCCGAPSSVLDYRYPDDDWCEPCHCEKYPEDWEDWDSIRKSREAQHGG